MKKIIIFFILIINIFLYQSLFSSDLSTSCRSTKIRKGDFLVTTAKYCKISGAKYEKIVTYQDFKWNDFIRKEWFNATFADGDKYKKKRNTYQNGYLAIVEWFDYTYADGNKFRKEIITYQNDKKVKEEIFDYTYANGEKYKQRIETYENRKGKEEYFDYTYPDGVKYKRKTIIKGLFGVTKDVRFVDYTYADGDKFRWSTEYNDVNQQREVKEIYGYYIKKENKTFDVVNWRGDWSTCLFDYYQKGKIIKTQDNPSRNCKK